MKLGSIIIGMFAVALLGASLIGRQILATTLPNVPEGAPSSSTNLKVKKAIDSTPQPLDFRLQGSVPENGQSAAGNLQQGKTAEELQPNAKTDGLQNDE